MKTISITISVINLIMAATFFVLMGQNSPWMSTVGGFCAGTVLGRAAHDLGLWV